MNKTGRTALTIADRSQCIDRWAPALLGLVSVLLHLPAVTFGFIGLDDADLVAALDRYLRAGGSVFGVGFRDYHFSGSGGYYRPLASIVLALQVKWFGTAPGWLHLVSCLLHGACVALLTKILFRSEFRGWRGAIFATVFAVHPVAFAATSWLSVQHDILLTIGLLLVAWGTLDARDQTMGMRPLAMIVVGSLIAALSKESGILAPLVPVGAGLTDRLLRKKGGLADHSRPFAASLAGPVLFLTLREGFAEVGALPSLRLSEAISRLPVLFLQIGKAALPFGHKLLPGLDVAIVFAGLVTAVALSVLLWRFRDQAAALFGPAGALLFISLVPGIFSRQDIPDTYFENRNYLTVVALLGCTSALTIAKSQLWERRGLRLVSIAIVLLFLIAGFGFGRAYESRTSFWSAAIRQSPEHPLALLNSGMILQESGRLQDAEELYVRAKRAYPRMPFVNNNLGTIALQRNQSAAAAEYFRTELQIQPHYAVAHVNLAIALLRTGQLEAAEPHLVRALQLDPASRMAGELLSALRAEKEPRATQ